MASIQVGKTEVGLNWVGYTIDSTPGPMLAVLPTIEVGERWSKQRLASMIDSSPSLRRKIAPARSRDSGNTATLKEFDGGILIIGGSNSASSLSSMPIKKLLLDEVDRFPTELEEEGDPVDIAEGRTTTFQRRKILKVSSPTIESLSRINKDWKRSDQRRYHVPCPDCGHKQVLRWESLNWPEGEPAKARYACEACGVLIEEHRKTWMLENGEWIATHPGREVVGFHINALYSPAGLGRTWAAHAKRYDEVKHDPVRLKVFVNQVLGECFADPDERLDWEELKGRAEGTKLREIPRGCLVLTAGVDVQKDRLEVQVCGWGKGDTMWGGIDWLVIPGDPLRPEVWEALDKYFERPFVNQFGVSMRIAIAFVDAGYLPDEVLSYTRGKRQRGIYGSKGSSVRGRMIISRPSKVDINRRGVTIKSGAELWMLGVDALKHRFFARLASDRKRALPEERLIRFGGELTDDYFMQLTAEIFDPNKRLFVKLHGRHNEALDTALLAMAAGMHPRLRLHVMKEHDWERIAATIEPKVNDLFTATAPTTDTKDADAAQGEAQADAAPPTTAAPAPRSGRGVRSRPNWVTNYRH